MNSQPCIVVAGLGRCGSSLLMQMLSAGGVPCLGSYPDFEDERTVPETFSAPWFDGLRGCAVKILEAHRLPIMKMPGHIVIWLYRDEIEQAKSALKFLASTGMRVDNGRRAVRAFAAGIRRDSSIASARLGLLHDNPTLAISFATIVEHPTDVASKISRWLARFGFSTDPDAMAGQVVPRPATCLPYMLETYLVEPANGSR